MRSFLLLAFLIFVPMQAQAHKIHVFAWVSGDIVTVESNFSGNKPLLHGKITVKDKTSGDVLLQGDGDDQGLFKFTVPLIARKNKTDLLIVVTGSEGHQSEWLLPATEYLSIENIHTTDHSAANINSEEIQEIIRTIIIEELEPIKRSLAESKQQKPGLNDIMGGIGYLIGLAGLAAWLRNRNPKSSKTDD